MEPVGQGQQGLVGKGRSNQGNSKRQTIAAETRRHGDGGQIQQVDEIGVVTQVGIQADGVCFHRFPRVDGAGGRQKQSVHAGPLAFGRAAQFLELVFGVVSVDGGVAAGAGNNLAHDGVHLFAVGFDERADGGQALGHPRAGVEQVGGGAKQGEIDFHFPAAQRFHIGDGLPIEGGGFIVSEKFQLIGSGHAKAKRPAQPGRRSFPDARRARVRIGGVEATGRQPNQMRAEAGMGEDGNAIQAAARGHYAIGAEQAAGGLQADQVVERCGHASAAGRIRSEGETHQAGSHGHGRAGAGPSRDIARVKNARTGAIWRPRSHQPGSELIQIGFADGNRPGVDKGLYRGAVAVRRVGVGRASGGSRQTLQIDVVLHRKGYAIKRAGRPQGIVFQDPGAFQRHPPRHHRNPNRFQRRRADSLIDPRDYFRRTRRAGLIRRAQAPGVQGNGGGCQGHGSSSLSAPPSG